MLNNKQHPCTGRQGGIADKHVYLQSQIPEWRDRELERLTAFFDNFPAPVFQASPEGRILKCNLEAARLFPVNMANVKIFELFPSLDKSSLNSATVTEPFQIQQAVADQVFVFTVLKESSTDSFFIYGTDITIRTKIEQVLKNREEEYRLLVENQTSLIVKINPRGEFLFVSKSYCETFGKSEKELLGQRFPLLDGNDDEECLQKIIRNLGAPPHICHKDELMQTHSGPRWLAWSNKAVMNAGGEIETIICVGRDITERLEAEKALQESREKYRVVVENAGEAIIVLQDNKFKFFNAKSIEILGHKPEEIASKIFLDFVHPSDRKFVHEIYQKRISGEATKDVFDCRIIDSSGNIKWAQVSSVAIKWDGRAAGLAFITDVTEHYKSREQLLRSDKLAAIGTLAAGVAHEINNPIGYINSNLSTMQKYLSRIDKFIAVPAPGVAADTAAIIEIIADFSAAIDESIEGAMRVKRIVSDLKGFARMDKVDRAYANINETLDSTLNIVWNELKYKCEVKKQYGELPDLYCIPSQLSQVFMNLLVNAGQAISGNKGQIVITTRQEGDNIKISIKDNGCGIPKENLNKIFEPFFTTKEVGKGTGLGLSVIYDIVKKHHGAVDVNSEAGVGAEFIVTLPLQGPDAEGG